MRTGVFPKKRLLEFYKSMILSRKTEQKIKELADAGEILGTHHESSGQEAIAVAIAAVKKPDDVLGLSVRTIANIVAVGGDLKGLFAELFGRATGYNKGFGGSMHLNVMEKGLWGVEAVLGCKTSIVVGYALKCKLKKTSNIAIATYGDGASNLGVIHEVMNMAAIWKLPVVFLCENNQYAVTTSIRYATSIKNLSERAAAYGFEGVTVDGMDVEQIYGPLKNAVDKARAGEGPSLVECITYRFAGHMIAEPRLNVSYRTEEEIEYWKKRDPIKIWANKLITSNICTQDDLDNIDKEATKLIDEAVEFARKSPWPDPEEALKYMYASENKYIPARGW